MEHSVEHLTLASMFHFGVWQHQMINMKKNYKIEPVTIDDIRKINGNENISDEDANELLHSINHLVEIIYHHYKSGNMEYMEQEYLQAA